MRSLAFVEQSDLFKGLTSQQMKSVADSFTEKTYKANEIIIAEDDVNTLVYLLIHGSAKVIKYDENKISHQIAVINEGDVFGEISSLDNAPSSASIVALIDCKVYAFSLHELKDLSHPKKRSFFSKVHQALRSTGHEESIYSVVTRNLTKSIGKRLRRSNESVVENLKIELAQSKERNAMGLLIINVIAFLCFYMWLIQLSVVFRSHMPSSTYMTMPIIIVFALAVLVMVKKSGYPLSLYGITFEQWKPSMRISIFYSGILALICLAYKWVIIHYSPDKIGEPLFRFSSDSHGPSSSLLFDVSLISIYMIFVPVQELIVRGVLQSSFYEFITGRHRNFWAILLSNLLFSITHMHLSLAASFIVFVPGLFWGWLYSRYRTLVGVIFSHLFIGIWAFFIVGIF